MKKYKETYLNLYHGTTKEAANSILTSQMFIPSSVNNWCGEGIYFYDNKAKALWAAHRKCNEVFSETGVRTDATYVNADIVDLEREYILDLRDYKQLLCFSKVVDTVLEEVKIDIAEELPEEEKIIILRGILISYFAQEYDKKLIIGHFQQRSQEGMENAFSKAESLHLVIGVETIYCVKDASIISAIRGGHIDE